MPTPAKIANATCKVSSQESTGFLTAIELLTLVQSDIERSISVPDDVMDRLTSHEDLLLMQIAATPAKTTGGVAWKAALAAAGITMDTYVERTTYGAILASAAVEARTAREDGWFEERAREAA